MSRQRLVSGGAEANERLTSSTGLILLVLLAVEGVTVLQVRSLLRMHVFVGVLLIPPVMVKLSSTVYRFLRYYQGTPDYRLKGPPHWLLRVLGPGVVVLTVVLLASGVGLMFVGPAWHGRFLLVHKASFFLWFAAMTVHVLGHLGESGRLGLPDWMPGRRVAGAGSRRSAVMASLVVGAGAGLLILSRVGPYLGNLPSRLGR